MSDDLTPEALMAKAVRACASARALLDLNDVDGACNRAYYAMFDIDFLVSFEEMKPEDYADAYFGLLEDLQALFGRPIDLVTESGLRNPWLRREVEHRQSVLYAA